MTLKTTKEQRNKLIFQAEADAKAGEWTLLPEWTIQDLCHDADRARELEKEIQTLNKCAFIGSMRDCPTHGESEELKRLKQENADLRAKLDGAYEKAARVVEERGARIGGAIRPDKTARAIRALKEQEKP